MQYPVPQFIDVEDKVIGPLTIKQFLWLFAAAGGLMLEFFLLPFVGFVIAGIPTAGIFAAMAFYKIQGKPFYNFLLDLMSFSRRPKVRVWRREVDLSMSDLFPSQVAEKKEQHPLTIDDVDLNQLVNILDHELGSSIDQNPVVDPMAGRIEFSESSSNLLPPVQNRMQPLNTVPQSENDPIQFESTGK